MALGLSRIGSGVNPAEPQRWRWTAGLYEKAVEQGFFDGQRVELLDGEVTCMGSEGEPHVIGMSRLLRSLHRKLPDSLFVRAQGPLFVDENSRPEPDVAVVDAASPSCPTLAHLVVEVMEGSSHFERTIKGTLYAAVPVAERWLLDVSGRTLEIQREPFQDEHSFSGWRYSNTRLLREDATLSPLCAPGVEFTVREMLP